MIKLAVKTHKDTGEEIYAHNKMKLNRMNRTKVDCVNSGIKLTSKERKNWSNSTENGKTETKERKTNNHVHHTYFFVIKPMKRAIFTRCIRFYSTRRCVRVCATHSFGITMVTALQ